MKVAGSESELRFEKLVKKKRIFDAILQDIVVVNSRSRYHPELRHVRVGGDDGRGEDVSQQFQHETQ